MAKNRFAQPLYGKIIYIYETDLTKDQLSLVFDPGTYWIDVTGIDCEVGYVIDYVEGGGLVFVPPQNNEPLTLEEVKNNKVAEMKAVRDSREIDVIQYNEIILDYDDKARERMRIAEKALVDNGLENILWTCADNTHALLTVQDFININTIAATRSSELHARYNSLKEYIETLEDVEKVEAVTFDMEIPENTEEEIPEETIEDSSPTKENETEQSTDDLVNEILKQL